MAPDVPVEAGQLLSLRPDPGALHFFDAASGERLALAP
jgi:hypothetical protein